ncbi:transketolase [Streptobacillus notomytis]|uniref:transketolase n=1 Tax=Streptobacillus notomytis TaxID=1712031 RepID=UPI000A608EF5|nr:transketolase [Streptobacillus notomytis]
MITTKEFAKEIRINVLKMLNNLGFGHYGGSLSVVETLAVLYNDIMKYDPKNPNWEERDYFVLSKGHAGPALYSALALKGFFPVEDLLTLNINGTKLPSHPDRLKTSGVDITTGSLGQGISIATGIAKALKIKKKENRVFTIIGDGEAQEGQVWEAIQFIAHNKLNNLITFIDYNKQQLDGYLEDICKPYSFEEKVKSFGLDSLTVKGDDIEAIKVAILSKREKPLVIVLDSIKGQGVDYIENFKGNHHIRANEEVKKELEKAINDLQSGVK